MRFVANLLSLALVASSTWAAPVAGRQDDLTLYQLQISSPHYPQIDGQWIVSNGSTLGLFVEDQPPVQVFTLESEKKGLVELHTYPIGIVDHALGLHGPPGLLTFVDLPNPRMGDPEDGMVKVWDTFRVSGGKLVNGGEGEWYTFPLQTGGWVVKWYDGSIAIIANYMPVEILMREVDKGNDNLQN
ncbi:hypothetical protein DL766_004544 [Monosporascus sp. MC13-8B]|uniref:Uncharacterized protein n=1 Tax=Monosporascus cannonballus TaxID=155416 RepID=A0ABY0HJV7_9PEZI|nr:hypothetical protein DL763_005732 [Monosporascus cannonballus]RYO94162.1 hypothetical protein DL762_000672 [Monosporascus cannonballus]RYP31114.1 hypothetical protein DL766_004544 [Monosporascus sp. MC13-8B]